MIGHAREMAEKRNPLGPTGETLQANVIALRERQNLTYAQLSRKLKAAGRAIPELGLRRIEGGDRRVDVDDLMALAAANSAQTVRIGRSDRYDQAQPRQHQQRTHQSAHGTR